MILFKGGGTFEKKLKFEKNLNFFSIFFAQNRLNEVKSQNRPNIRILHLIFPYDVIELQKSSLSWVRVSNKRIKCTLTSRKKIIIL